MHAVWVFTTALGGSADPRHPVQPLQEVVGGELDSAPGGQEVASDERGMMPSVAAQDDARGVRHGPEKCVFIYNANRNRFRANWFERCGIGVHFTAGDAAFLRYAVCTDVLAPAFQARFAAGLAQLAPRYR